MVQSIRQTENPEIQNLVQDAEVQRSIIVTLVSITLFGLVLFLVLFNIRQIRQNQGQITFKNALLMGAAILFLTIYQSLNIFYYAGQQQFLPYSAIFLNMNFLILSIVFFVDKIQKSQGIEEFLGKNFPEKDRKEVDRKREGSLINEIQAQSKDETWKCSFFDLSDVVTPIQVCKSDFENLYFSKVKKFQLLNILKLALILASFGILLFYAFILYQVDNGDKLGMIIAISVTCLDFFNILRSFNQQNHKNTVIYLILNRVLLVSLGDTLWIYGCMIIYLIYGSDLVLQIAQRRFPFDSDIFDEKSRGIYPSILLVILSVMYCSLLYVVQYVNYSGKNIQKLIFNPGLNQTEVGVGLSSIMTVGMIFTVYLVVSIARMFIRKAYKTMKADGYAFFNEKLTKKNKFITMLNIFIVLVYICFIFWFVIFYKLTKDTSLIIWGVFLPVIIISYSNGFTYFVLNEFCYLQDVNRLNKTIDIHNIKIGQLEKRKEIIMKQIADKTLFVDDLPTPTLNVSQKLQLKNNVTQDLANFKELVKTDYLRKKTQFESLLKTEGDQEQNLASSKVLLNIDEAEQEYNGLQKIQESRLMRVKDWRKETSFIQALIQQKLRPNDKYFIYSMAIAFIAWVGLFIGLAATQAAIKGVVIAMLYLGVSLIISSSVIYQSRALAIKELIPWIAFNLVYIGASLAYFFVSFENSKSSPQGFRYIFYYILTLPTIIHGMILLLRVVNRGFDGLFGEFKLFIFIFSIGKLSMIIFSFFISPVGGGIYLISVVLVISAIRVGFLYRQNGQLTSLQTKLSVCLASVIIVIPTFISLFHKSYTIYKGFSTSVFFFFIMICFYSVGSWLQDLREKNSKPVYCSRFIFPIYKFNQIKKDFEPHNGPTIAWFLGLSVLLLWSFLTSFLVKTIWEGAFLSVLIETLIFLSAMFFSSKTLDLINDANTQVDEKVCKQSWLQIKEMYFKENGVFSSGQRDSFRRLWKHEYFLNGYDKILNKSLPDQINQDINKDLIEEIQKEQVNYKDQNDFYQKKIEDLFSNQQDQLQDKAKINKLLNEVQERLKNSYQKEMILLIRFIIIALQNFNSAQETEMKNFLRFLNEKTDIFQSFGIKIIVSKHLSTLSQYKQANQQIENLETDKLQKFKQIEEATKLEKQREAEKAMQTRDGEKQRHEERQKELEENQKQKEEAVKYLESQPQGNIDLSIDPNTLPDCLKKYQLIVERAKKSNIKFVDAQFSAVDKSIGDEVIKNLGHGTRKWITASQDKHQSGKPFTIFQDGVDFSDIEQGALGDCYYLSALAVLGSEHTKQRFVFLSNEEEWKQCGAFCLKFYFDGLESIVIIDDKFLTVNGEFPFVKTPSRVEMWPMILEKAYAKFYGSYQNIEGGFVHKALQELISGIPVLLSNEKQTDKNQFYEKLKLYQSQGFPMGAGSPAHQDGDKAISPMGIVQGHAFSVIKVAQVDNVQLICIRNPWGQGEWTGDWSDNSDKWTPRAKNMVGYTESKDDGVFWMDFNDYLKEFDEIYVCMTLTPSLGWTCYDLFDKWEGKYGQGVPSGNNRQAKLTDSPQFALTINKPGKAHMVFRVKEKIDSNNPAVYPYLNIQDNDGQLISRQNSAKELAVCGPTNLIVQACEIEFKAGLKYPLTITVLASFIPNDEHPTKEKNFRLQVYTQDDKASFKKMN